MSRPNAMTGLADVLGGVVAVAVGVVLGLLGQPDWVWSAVLGSTLVLRRGVPVVFAALTVAVSGAHFLTSGGLLFPADLVLIVAIHSLALHGSPRLRHLGLVIGVVGAAACAAAANPGASLEDKLMVAALILTATLAAWSIGLQQRQRAAALTHATERAAYLERDSAHIAKLATYDERVRISREMHDVIAHTLASVIAQAEGGRMAARHNSELAGSLFDHIAGTGRQALGDVKTLLHLIDDGEDCRPAPTLRDLPSLVEHARASGLALEHETTGTARELPPGVSLAIYRVVQESITNILKHAPGARAALTIEWHPTFLQVSTTNSTLADHPRALTAGRGLSGIRQRCELFGATMATSAGNARFELTTRWPLTLQEAGL